ncbi:DUF6712 family protein [Pontibacter litorisediminis]|uniref:DUF6712 family protein n=1 Tax=Pontibacter litorisediminis TaxID=1846260 RepID=UPI0023EE16B1|nr:DUF6712 family protein [Pontibacter litorisediminis]
MPLIKTDEDFRRCVRVGKSNFSLENVMPDILLVERDVIKKHLGAELYLELHDGYTDGTLNEKQTELLRLVQYALGNLAMVSYMAVNQVQISDGGITKSSASAYRYQVRELKLNLITKGYNGLESVLEFLEEHKNDENFAKWATSSAVVVSRENFINSAREFSREYNINNSRLTYLSLQSIIRKVEPFMLEPVLGTALFEELKEQILRGEVSEENQVLLRRFIRPAVAHFTVAKALPERSFRFSGDTITLNLEELLDDSSQGAATDNDALLLRKIEQAYTDGTTFLGKLRDYLNQHASADKYSAYFNSELYAPPTTEAEPVVYRNRPDTNLFAFI